MVEEKVTIYIIKLEVGYKIVCSGFHEGKPVHWDSMESLNTELTYHQAKIREKRIKRDFRNMLGGYIATKVIDDPDSESLHFPAKELVSTELSPS